MENKQTELTWLIAEARFRVDSYTKEGALIAARQIFNDAIASDLNRKLGYTPDFTIIRDEYEYSCEANAHFITRIVEVSEEVFNEFKVD